MSTQTSPSPDPTAGKPRWRKVLLVCLLIIACAIGADLIYSGFFRDLSFVLPRHECLRNIIAYREGEDVSCPLANGVTGYDTFPEDNLTETGQQIVVAADKGLFHEEPISLFFPPKKFAVVLLNDGSRDVWYGREADYQLTLEDAHKSTEGRFVERFFGRSEEPKTKAR